MTENTVRSSQHSVC